MRVAIDGTTGLLGRNLLFEILKQHINKLDDIEIVIFGKGTNGYSLQARMEDIIFNDGFDYLKIDKTDENPKIEEIRTRIKYIDFDLTLSDLGISQENLDYLKKVRIDYFYHIAALSSFFDTPSIAKQLEIININGTNALLDLIILINVKKFLFVSSAYNAGSDKLEFLPTDINNTMTFRNPYEKTKLEAELFLLNFAKINKINFQILRITTISGRLIENPIGSINKYDVFYGWGMYFLKQKLNLLKDKSNIDSQPLEINLRVLMHPESTMNIIPADYGAKLLYHISLEDTKDKSFHLVNDLDISINSLVNIMLDSINIKGHHFVDQEPNDKNILEQMYYRTVGKIFTPYMIDPPIKYNNDNVQEIIKKNNLECPLMTDENFKKLIDYAVEHNFGLNI